MPFFESSSLSLDFRSSDYLPYSSFPLGGDNGIYLLLAEGFTPFDSESLWVRVVK